MLYHSDSIRKEIERVVYALDKRGIARLTTVKLHRVKRDKCMSLYYQTLVNVKGECIGEPISKQSTEMGSCTYKPEKYFTSDGKPLGYEIVQTQTARIRDEMMRNVEKHCQVDWKFFTSGGVYYTIPNKSYDKILQLQRNPEYLAWLDHFNGHKRFLDIISFAIAEKLNSGLYLIERYTKGERPIFSYSRPEASLGIKVFGSFINRERLDQLRVPESKLKGMLQYSHDMAVAFAASQMVDVDTETAVMIDVLYPSAKLVVASRSDFDAESISLVGDLLTVEGKTKTRQAGTTGESWYSVAALMEKYRGISPNNSIRNKFTEGTSIYTPQNRENLFEFFSLPPYTVRSKGLVFIGEDIGMVEPIKAPADGLFSNSFVKIGRRVLPEMLSGIQLTDLIYLVMWLLLRDRIRELGVHARYQAQGDDFSIETEAKNVERVVREGLQPYDKLKSQEGNTTKIAGFLNIFEGDVNSDEDVKITSMETTRVFTSRTTAGSVKAKTDDGLDLTNLPDSGSFTTSIPPEQVKELREQIKIVHKYKYVESTGRKAHQEHFKQLFRHFQEEIKQISPELINRTFLYNPATEEEQIEEGGG